MRESIMHCDEVLNRIKDLRHQSILLEEKVEESKTNYWTYRDIQSELKLFEQHYEKNCRGLFHLFIGRVLGNR